MPLIAGEPHSAWIAAQQITGQHRQEVAVDRRDRLDHVGQRRVGVAAHDDGAGWRLEGAKYYSTGAITARWLAASALDPDERLVLALVERDRAGVAIGEDWSAMGQRATVSGTTTFDGVRVDDGFVVPYWTVFTEPQLLGARTQLVHAAIEAGIAQGALADAAEFLRTRSRPFAEAYRADHAPTAAEDPNIRLRFGRLATRTRAAVQLLRWAADVLEELGLIPAGPDTAAHGSIAVAQAKAFASEVPSRSPASCSR